MKRLVLLSACVGMLLNSTAQGNEAIAMHFVDENGIGASAGQVFVSETKFGLVFTPALAGLPPGVHGFHVHEHASCLSLEKEGKKIPAAKAGGHYDPEKTAAHGFPWGEEHLGDHPRENRVR
ncbi:MAG TPA: superoxide dismutase family protein, partial [Accumulibacter sp.]|nr:superoxide dismutase family protein [Accumulibacter sp.]